MKRASICTFLAVTGTLLGASGATSSGKALGLNLPSVYTCEWIAANPTEATAMRVSCNETMVNPGADLERANALREQLSAMTSSPLTRGSRDAIPAGQGGRTFIVQSTGYQRVPLSGSIGTNVYASTSFEYSLAWGWTGSSQSGDFYWYIKKTDGSNQVWNFSNGIGGEIGVPGNIYEWKVQNKASVPQYWARVDWID